MMGLRRGGTSRTSSVRLARNDAAASRHRTRGQPLRSELHPQPTLTGESACDELNVLSWPY